VGKKEGDHMPSRATTVQGGKEGGEALPSFAPKGEWLLLSPIKGGGGSVGKRGRMSCKITLNTNKFLKILKEEKGGKP